MAMIPRTFQVDQQPAGAIQGQFASRSETPPATPGAATGRALSALGETLQQTGGVLTQQAIKDQEVINDTEATETATNISRTMSEELARFSALQGSAATAAFPAFQQRMRELETQALEGASNPRVRQMLRARLAGRVEGSLGAGLQHNLRQGQTANVEANVAAANQAVAEGLAAAADPVARGRALLDGLGRVEQIGRLQGWGPEALAQNRAEFVGRFYSALIAQTVQTDPIAAQELFDRNRGDMDAASQLRMQDLLANPVRRERAAGIVRDAAQGRTGTPQANGRQPGAAPNVERDVIARAENPWGDERRNENSTASGPLQITDPLWRDYAPRLGLSDAQRNERGAQERIYDAVMADAQARIGRPLNLGEKYAVWVLGIGGARAFFNAPRDADALEVYRAAAGERIANEAFRVNGRLMQPGMNVGQVLDALAGRVQQNAQQAPVNTRRNQDQVLRDALQATEGDPRMQAEVITQFNIWRHMQEQADAQAQAQMTARVRDITAALQMGSNVSIPEADIRAVFEPQRADAIIAELNTAQIAGQVYQSVQSATPAELTSMRDDLATGTGPISQLLRARRGTRVGDDGQVIEEDRPGDVVARAAVRNMMDQRIEQRNRELTADPAQFVIGSSPQVREAAQRLADNPGDPALMAAYVEATRAEQSRLGVARENQRVLSVAQAQAMALDVMRADPADEAGGPVVRLRSIARAYGPAWPAAFRDMVRDGRLPAEYEVLANIETAVGQADYSRMLAAMQQMGGAEQFRAAVRRANPTEEGRLRQELATYVQDFVATALANGQSGGDRLAGMVTDAVGNLAAYYIHRGANAADALQRASDRVINDRYEISGEMRVPRRLPDGRPLGLAPVRQGINTLMNGFRQTDMADPPDTGSGLPMDVQRQVMWRAAQRGVWVPNETDTGLVWMMDLENGGRIPVRRQSDGARVEVMFDNLPQPRIPAEGLAPPRRGSLRGGVRPIEGWDEPDPAQPASEPPAAAPVAPPVRSDVLPGERLPQGTQPRNRNRWEPPQ